MKKNIPSGVKVISVLYFVFSFLAFLVAAVLFLTGAYISSDPAAVEALLAEEGIALSSEDLASLGGSLGAVGFLLLFFGGIAFLYCILALVAGIGLWMGKKWGRILTLVLSSLSVLYALLLIFSFNVASFVLGIICLAVHGTIIWYLLKKDVIASFVKKE